jgi:hypothetical protein
MQARRGPVLLKIGLPWIRGYKPMFNYQDALLGGIEQFLQAWAGFLEAPHGAIGAPFVNAHLAETPSLFIEALPSWTTCALTRSRASVRRSRLSAPACAICQPMFAGEALIQPLEASACSYVWHVKSNYRYRVQIAFYSQNRRFEWPGKGRAYGLNDYDVHEYSMVCKPGEKICFGAWVTDDSSTYWGVGFDNKHSCESCCYVCGCGAPWVVLDEESVLRK